MAKIVLTLNGEPVEREADAGMALLTFLRDVMGLTGTKQGCGHGECGACTVILNGEAVDSCLVPVMKAAGGEVVTVEGLSRAGTLSPLQRAFIEKGAIQCGFCTPGMLMSAQALLNRTSAPSDDEIKEAIGGNICRCTGYAKIIEAIRAAAQEGRGECDHE